MAKTHRTLRRPAVLSSALIAVGALTLINPSAKAQGLDPMMQHRFNGIFLLNFGDNANAVGLEMRYDHPIHEFVTAGALLSFFGTKVDVPRADREPGMDLAAFVRARYAFDVGRRKSRLAEAYGLFHVGPTFGFGLNNPFNGASDGFAPGFNVGFAPGFQIFITERVGVLSELGFIHRQVTAKDRGQKLKIKGSQGLLRLGVTVMLP